MDLIDSKDETVFLIFAPNPLLFQFSVCLLRVCDITLLPWPPYQTNTCGWDEGAARRLVSIHPVQFAQLISSQCLSCFLLYGDIMLISSTFPFIVCTVGLKRKWPYIPVARRRICWERKMVPMPIVRECVGTLLRLFSKNLTG